MRLIGAGEAHLSQIQRLFSSNVTYLRLAGELPPDADELPTDHARRYVEAETAMAGGRCLVAMQADDVVATVALLVPHPNEPYPWLGLLLVDGTRQRSGAGSAVASAVESSLAREGWPEIRLAVLVGNVDAYRFWVRQGYRPYRDSVDTSGRPCSLMRKTLRLEVEPSCSATTPDAR